MIEKKTRPPPYGRGDEIYCQEAENYDREFIGKHDEDLSTTLIFVSLSRYLEDTHANFDDRLVCSRL